MNTLQNEAANAATSRSTAVAAGVLYLITHVTSVGSAALYGPILNHPGYITGAGPDGPALWGAFLEVILALAVVGTAVALFPVVRRHHEGLAMGYVGLRTLEAAIIAAGVIPLLAAVTLRREMAVTVEIADAGTVGLSALGSALVAWHNWTLVLGPGLVCGTNTVVMAYLVAKARLVPRFIPVLGLIGGPAVMVYHAAGMLAAGSHIPAWAAVAVIPIFAWELSLAIWLIARGFNPPAGAAGPPIAVADELLHVMP